jgi:fatty-acyl-CoA synthase
VSGISSWARFWARYGADRPALVHPGADRTWGQLEEACAHLAAGFLAAGLRKGDRVGGLLRNAPEYIEVILGCARIGAVFVPLNPLLTASELRILAEDSGLSALVTDASFVSVLGPFDELIGAERIFFAGAPPAAGRSLQDLHEHGAVRDDRDVGSQDPMLICYTSGTTGRPKGAVLTHGNLEAVASGAIAFDALTREDRGIITVPLAFTGASVSVVMPFLRCGGSLAIRHEFVPARVLDDIERGGVTFIGVVPLILERMAAEPDFGTRDLAGLRVAKVGGAAVPEHLLRIYTERGIGLVNAYALTEGSGLNLELQAHEALRKLGSVGIPLLGQEAKVIDADGNQAAPGEPGELLLAGSTVMKEYWRNPQATAEALRAGWLHTGDIASMDTEGYFRIVDRAKDMIISGGINIYPAEIEAVLSRHPDVAEVAVVGMPDETWGEAPVACIVTGNRELSLEQLNTFAEGSLAHFKRPRQLVLRDTPLPRSMSGKILKRAIRGDLLAGDPGGRTAR